jgi:apolipoprotein N-acyltransferase
VRIVLTSGRVKAALCLAAGGVLPLAYAPFGYFWIAPLSYAALFFAWRGTTPREAFWRGALYGLASFLAGLYWIYISVHIFGLAPIGLAVFLTVGLVVLLASFIAVTGWAAARWFGTNGAVVWLGALPALWVLTEWCRGWFLTGFGWLAAGYSQTDSWLMAYAPVCGVEGMSWAVMLTAGALVSLAAGTRRGRVAAALVMLAVWGLAYPLSNHRWTKPQGKLINVALVQGAVPQNKKWNPDYLVPTMSRYRQLTETSTGRQLIVWPEAAIPALYRQVRSYLDDVAEWAKRRGAVLMLGILRTYPPGTDNYQNSLVALTQPPQFYVKHHLVPFGEYFPVPQFVRNWMRLMSLPYTDDEPGPADQPPLKIGGLRIAVTICYEDVFGAEQLHYLPEANLLVNVSNDAWFGDSTAPHQHLQIAQVRAAEAGRYLLRATNTGMTAVIDPSGRIVKRLPQFKPAVLDATVQGFIGSTPYARWGNYAVVSAACLVLLIQLLTTKLTIRPGT